MLVEKIIGISKAKHEARSKLARSNGNSDSTIRTAQEIAKNPGKTPVPSRERIIGWSVRSMLLFRNVSRGADACRLLCQPGWRPEQLRVIQRKQPSMKHNAAVTTCPGATWLIRVIHHKEAEIRRDKIPTEAGLMRLPWAAS